ncbi:MAG: biotin/lipoyl-binding protein, partial [Acidobacteriota bacterium]
MTRPTRWYLLGGFFLAAGLGGAHYVRDQGHGDYQFSTVERGDLQSVITATGTSNAVVTAQVGSQVSGNIKALYADFNTKVKKGQVIALIDQEIFQARVNQFRANLDSAQSAIVSARAQSLKVAADIAGAQANLKNEQANLAKAKVTVLDGKNKLDRRVLLVKEGLASREDLDSAQDVAASFQAPTIFEIAQDLTRMQVDASIDEAPIGRVPVGQPATFTVANSDLKLLPGMTANVKILTDQAKGVLKIPNLALRFRPPDTAVAPAKAAYSGPRKGDTSRALTESEARRSLAVL